MKWRICIFAPKIQEFFSFWKTQNNTIEHLAFYFSKLFSKFAFWENNYSIIMEKNVMNNLMKPCLDFKNIQAYLADKSTRLFSTNHVEPIISHLQVVVATVTVYNILEFILKLCFGYIIGVITWILFSNKTLQCNLSFWSAFF